MAGGARAEARGARLLCAMEKLDSRTTEGQGMKELREHLVLGGEPGLQELVGHVIKNLKRQDTHVHAIGECVTLLSECAEMYPNVVASTYLAKIIGIIVRQLGRPDARCRDTCSVALGKIAAALADVEVVDSPPFGPVAGLRLAPFFAPLFSALAEPRRHLQEGAAAAVRAVLLHAAAQDVSASLPALIPKLLSVLRSSVSAKDAVLAALESCLNAAEPDLQLEYTVQLVHVISKCLAAPQADFKIRSAAARCSVPLLGALAPQLARSPAAVVDAISLIRSALEKVRYDRYLPVREAAVQALREISSCANSSPASASKGSVNASPPASTAASAMSRRQGRPSTARALYTFGEGASGDDVVYFSSPIPDPADRAAHQSQSDSQQPCPPPGLLEVDDASPPPKTLEPKHGEIRQHTAPLSPHVTTSSPSRRGSDENRTARLSAGLGILPENTTLGFSSSKIQEASQDKENPGRRARSAAVREKVSGTPTNETTDAMALDVPAPINYTAEAKTPALLSLNPVCSCQQSATPEGDSTLAPGVLCETPMAETAAARSIRSIRAISRGWSDSSPLIGSPIEQCAMMPTRPTSKDYPAQPQSAFSTNCQPLGTNDGLGMMDDEAEDEETEFKENFSPGGTPSATPSVLNLQDQEDRVFRVLSEMAIEEADAIEVDDEADTSDDGYQEQLDAGLELLIDQAASGSAPGNSPAEVFHSARNSDAHGSEPSPLETQSAMHSPVDLRPCRLSGIEHFPLQSAEQAALDDFIIFADAPAPLLSAQSAESAMAVAPPMPEHLRSRDVLSKPETTTENMLRQALKRALDEKDAISHTCEEQRRMLAAERRYVLCHDLYERVVSARVYVGMTGTGSRSFRELLLALVFKSPSPTNGPVILRAHAAEVFGLRRSLHEERANRQQLQYTCDELRRMLTTFTESTSPPSRLIPRPAP